MASQVVMNALLDLLPSATATPPSCIPVAAGPMPSSESTLDADFSRLFSTGNMSPSSIASLLLSLLTNSQSMLKLMVIGGLFEAFRRFTVRLWHWFLDGWFINALYDDSNNTFDWMMVWLINQNIWANARDVHICTMVRGNVRYTALPLEDDSFQDNILQGKAKLAYLPQHDKRFWLRYKGTWMSVKRVRHADVSGEIGGKEAIAIKLFTRDLRVLKSITQDARNLYKAAGHNTIDIYGINLGGGFHGWTLISTRKKRPLHSIILEPEIINSILDDAKEFLASQKWYIGRGIPYRRGYLLHGVPGSGKTSLIHSIAGELGLNIYVVSLSKNALDDESLHDAICGLPLRCIALIEDIDAAFDYAGIARNGVSGASTETPPSALLQASTHSKGHLESGGVTLSGLLRALDGVAAQEGRILFATTNCYEVLDEALCRAGRMDIHVEFKMASRWQAKEVFRHFFLPIESEKAVAISGVSEISKAGSDLKGGEVLKTQVQAMQEDLRRAKVDALAERFADAVPERQFSVASLQGHLMCFKDKPHDAVDAVGEWIEQESRKRRAGVEHLKVKNDMTVGSDFQNKGLAREAEVKEVAVTEKEVKHSPFPSDAR